MAEDDSNKRVNPAVENRPFENQTYEGPTKPEQRSWNQGITLLIIALAAIFLVVIVVAWLAFR